ncbi:MAG: 16S rRNA (cytidine(1402)-2'-O)-methyltransferase [Lysobacterales bacterium]|jgi:16S rRNA (cytidine1402-2'-O)-methyltransferase
MSQSGLYLVATPIGNLEDISYRAVRILTEADLIAAEDTRHSRVLLAHYGITTPLTSLHEHNEPQVLGKVIALVSEGKSVALISDAGTPVISDPGYKLVRAAREAALPVYTVPGPSAVTAALSVAGLPPDRFAFEGFLPSKASARRRKMGALKSEPRTMVFFESSHRVVAALHDMAEIFGQDRLAAVCRELTKKFETVLRAPLGELLVRLNSDADQIRGEFVIVVEGVAHDVDSAVAKALELATALLDYLPASKAARVAAKLHNAPRRDVYRALGEKLGSE